ncbi:MAG: amidohydrolase [Planctomycetaceae bacterium]
MNRLVASLAVVCCCFSLAQGQESPTLRPAQQAAIERVEARADEIKAVNRAVWNFAEVGLQEHKSAALYVEKLKAAGFKVETGVAGMPTAFVAEYGSGQPIIGILAEYDALPGLSQKAAPYREPVEAGAAGHACGHSGLGAAAFGGAVAVKETMERFGLKGTVRLYGTPAEETGIGKVYMQLAGVFDDLDVCLHWHPATKNEVHWSNSSKALVSIKFTFHGTAAHASVSPESGISALDAVELMNVGVQYLREHVREDARIHHVITDGGGQPNVVPARAEVWYYVRADRHEDAEKYVERVKEIAQGAALMTRTKLDVRVDTDNHELIENQPLAQLCLKNLELIGPTKFTEEEMAFARRCQEPLAEAFGKRFSVALEEHIRPLTPGREARGSTDVGDISWHVPTGGFRTVCFPAEAPGHSWQNVASIGSSIGEKGTIYAAKVFAVTTIDLLEDPGLIAAAKADHQERMKGRNYTSLVPKGQKPPVSIR